MKINTAGLNLYFEAYGHGEPVLFLHGWGASSQMWQTLFPRLNTSPHQLLVVDLPGFGQSSPLPRPFAVVDYVKVVEGVVKELELTNLTLLGHSFGGKIALGYALRNPLKKLVLIDSAGIKRRDLRTQATLTTVKLLKPLNLRPLNSLRQKIAPYLQATNYRRLTDENLKVTFRLTIEEDLKNKLHNINVPTLIIWGGEDSETPLRDAAIMKKEIKNSVLKIIPESGHFPFLDHPETVAKIIAEFLSQP